MKHEKTFNAISKLKDVEMELHRLKNALEMANSALDAQRTWVGLTDEDIWEAYMESPLELDCSTDELYALSRTVEAKLKQKNGYSEEKNT